MLWKEIEIKKISDSRGTIRIAEQNKDFDFDIKRFYYLSDIIDGESRGAHAHCDIKQIIICVSGTFDIELDDGTNKKVLNMSNNSRALLLNGLLWRTMRNFSSDAIMLSLCDDIYSEDKVIRNYDEFIGMVESKNV